MSHFDDTIYAGSGNFYHMAYSMLTTGVPAGAYGVINLPSTDVRRVSVRSLINQDQRWTYSDTGLPIAITALPPVTNGSYFLFTGGENQVFIPTSPTSVPVPTIEFNNPSQRITHLVVQNRSSGQILSGVVMGYYGCPRYGYG